MLTILAALAALYFFVVFPEAGKALLTKIRSFFTK
jgi:hypothetical protein